MKLSYKDIFIFTTEKVEGGMLWKDMLKNLFRNIDPTINFDNNKDPDLVIILGGDGTILQAINSFKRNPKTKFLGLNLGTLGFLASVGKSKEFEECVYKLFKNDYHIEKRIALEAEIFRDNTMIDSSFGLNDIRIENLVGNAYLDVSVNEILMQKIHGKGVAISTPTGSTAFNLSIGGPVIKPEVKAIILSEILDHNIPTPSLILAPKDEIVIKIARYRKNDLLAERSSGEGIDIILRGDSRDIHKLKQGDTIKIRRYPFLIDFIAFEKEYFLHSLQRKLGFK